MMDLAERARRCQEYVAALEEERKKIQVFQRELPLCLHLVTQTIESVRQQIESEETVSDGPVLEEFIPLKPSLSSSEEGCAHEATKRSEEPKKKPDWLQSVQLWNQYPDPGPKMELPRRPIAVNAKKIGGAFQPFEREKHVPMPVSSATAASSSAGGSGGSGSGGGEKEMKDKEEKEGQSQTHRKTRRCWSPELHRRFLHALQKLGGSHAATPKQIRELMKVDGLTNDEVKSHLQKYRLHTRRPSPAVQTSCNSSPPAPQFVVVGGIWMPPPEYTAVAAATQTVNCSTAPANGIYTPVALAPSEFRFAQQQNKNQSDRSPTRLLDTERNCSAGEDEVEDGDSMDPDSPTSSSSQTTTASPPSQ
ncbi:transcription factor NIGT1-like [Typha latifolia]|uniref:transcription factor NIGT1-like n=1 Tax=Typha latifolia TaxID=4733 RepID=UPI003C2D695F